MCQRESSVFTVHFVVCFADVRYQIEHIRTKERYMSDIRWRASHKVTTIHHAQYTLVHLFILLYIYICTYKCAIQHIICLYMCLSVCVQV